MLTIAAADVLPPAVTGRALVVALALLAESFGRDVWWLWAQPAAAQAPVRRRAWTRRSFAVAPSRSAAARRGRVRTGVVRGAHDPRRLLLVWAALVAPDQPQDLTLTAFLRIPLEGLVLIALAVILPRIPRRILAVTCRTGPRVWSSS